jgi:hypothetical protein
VTLYGRTYLIPSSDDRLSARRSHPSSVIVNNCVADPPDRDPAGISMALAELMETRDFARNET